MASSDSAQRLPNLLVIGAMKASTTLLYSLLQQHPQVWFSATKEPCYFSRQDSESGWSEYLKLFADCPPEIPICGEASTTYTRMPHVGPVAERIRDRLGVPKMIYLLRDPVERAVSHYKHSYMSGYYASGMSIKDVLRDYPILLDSSRYAMQLDYYRQTFGDQQPFVVIAEQLHTDPAAALARVEAYLGIEPFSGWQQDLQPVNSAAQLGVNRLFSAHHPLLRPAKRLLPGAVKRLLQRRLSGLVKVPPVDEQDRQQIAELLADDLTALRRQLGPQIDGWPSLNRVAAKEAT